MGGGCAATFFCLKVRVSIVLVLYDLEFLSPPDLPFLKVWTFWKYPKRYFDVFGRFSKLIQFSVSAVACA